MDFGACPNVFCLLWTVLLHCLLSFGLCPGKWDPLAQESCRSLSFHIMILPCSIPVPVGILRSYGRAVAQLMVFNLFTSLWDVKVTPGVEADGERQMEIRVHVLEVLRDVFMEAHTHQR